eukprot:4328697-Prymnesium_polylepis.1
MLHWEEGGASARTGSALRSVRSNGRGRASAPHSRERCHSSTTPDSLLGGPAVPRKARHPAASSLRPSAWTACCSARCLQEHWLHLRPPLPGGLRQPQRR